MIGLSRSSSLQAAGPSPIFTAPPGSPQSPYRFKEISKGLLPLDPPSMQLSNVLQDKATIQVQWESKLVPLNKHKFQGISRGGAMALSSRAGAFFHSIFHPPQTIRRWIFWSLVAILVTSLFMFGSLYVFNEGFRRTVQFWRGMGPLVVEYKWIKLQNKLNMLSSYEDRIKVYNIKAAHKIVQLIQQLGGIYIKIGQVMSTIGQGLLPEEYIRALQPLQSGVPPKSFEQISQIVEKSTGRPIYESFVHFDPKPVGSASIAQAHRAVLRKNIHKKEQAMHYVLNAGGVQNNLKQNKLPQPEQEQEGEEVIVKVQYPEVARLFDADLTNLELVTKWFAPQNMELVRALRKRHENELDFRVEAANLVECRANLQRHGEEPQRVRIPQLKNETGLCTKDVLVMEYLKGIPLADVINHEQDQMARALGKANATELRTALAARMREHFERGGGAGDESVQDLLSAKPASSTPNAAVVKVLTGPVGARIFRTLVGASSVWRNIVDSLQNVVNGGTTIGVLNASKSLTTKKSVNVNLSRALKTLVRVHGLQMLKDGVYNADPHPVSIICIIFLHSTLIHLLAFTKLSALNNSTSRVTS